MSCHLNKANFMKHLQSGNIHATELRSMEQATRAVIVAEKGAHRGGMYPYSPENYEQVHRAMNYLERRKDRGGMTFRAGEALEHY